ncbi:MAG TPA: 50S ribosomal protein L25/general stress protein Ctc [Acidobacteriota bacterium]|nr:50S ribosomal protein L25/general stress protein Ctc [Acidobacteriota bacterium]
MVELVVRAQARGDLGKNASRRLRRQGQIPGVVYGSKFENVNIAVDPREITKILYSESGHNTIFQLEIEGEEGGANVLVRDYQLDPVRGTLIHADFQTVSMDEKMVFEVPIHPEGEAKGVVEGGVLDLVLREVEIECLPGDVPDHIAVDVTELEIGDSIRVSDLQVDTSKVEVLSEPDLAVVTVVPPQAEEPEEELLATEAEPELVGRKGAADEEEEEQPQEPEE